MQGIQFPIVKMLLMGWADSSVGVTWWVDSSPGVSRWAETSPRTVGWADLSLGAYTRWADSSPGCVCKRWADSSPRVCKAGGLTHPPGVQKREM